VGRRGRPFESGHPPFTPADPTISENIAAPHKLAALTIVSNELIADSNPSVIDLLTDNLSKSMALTLDLGFFEGTGSSSQPTGLKNVSGITLQSAGTTGATPTLDLNATAVYQLATDNAEATAIVMHPRSWAQIAKLKTGISGDLTYLVNSDAQAGTRPALFGVPVYLSGQLSITETQGSSSVASSVYVYEADQVIAFRREATEIKVNPYRLFNSDRSEIRAISRWDIQVPNPKSVVRIVGVL
jgi:HK97 family phage major capsid protein